MCRPSGLDRPRTRRQSMKGAGSNGPEIPDQLFTPIALLGHNFILFFEHFSLEFFPYIDLHYTETFFTNLTSLFLYLTNASFENFIEISR